MIVFDERQNRSAKGHAGDRAGSQTHATDDPAFFHDGDALA
jgi:hypothetical protein